MKNVTMFNENDFKKSSLCDRAPHCVAVAHKDDVVALMDTKNPKQPALHFNKEEWDAFVAGVKNGEFDY